ncbi:hypothetical protein [Longirhabdus pacifica]|uniref:hypothetical protein n=1 Tax=Longirhabdus pacifica TaxID=2305227 RepID=UPI0010092C94|nr:hypothetical protein [Longirhabdus pacifica]
MNPVPDYSTSAFEKYLPNMGELSNINQWLPDEHLPNEDYWILSITSSTCSACFPGIEELLVYNDDVNLPHINMLEVEKESDVLKYSTHFEDKFINIPINKEMAKKLRIQFFPYFILMHSEHGIVHNATTPQHIINFYQNLMKENQQNQLSSRELVPEG